MTRPWINFDAVSGALALAPLMAERGLGAGELALLINIARHLPKGENTGWVSRQSLAEESACSVKSIGRWLNALSAAKIIERKGRTASGVMKYRILFTPEPLEETYENTEESLIPEAAHISDSASHNSAANGYHYEEGE